MADDPRVSEWTKATRNGLRCPACLAVNMPGLHNIEVNGSDAHCTVCWHTWRLKAGA